MDKESVRAVANFLADAGALQKPKFDMFSAAMLKPKDLSEVERKSRNVHLVRRRMRKCSLKAPCLAAKRWYKGNMTEETELLDELPPAEQPNPNELPFQPRKDKIATPPERSEKARGSNRF